ncbi:unnamed protein product, partial [Prorocentrum cordatum]
ATSPRRCSQDVSFWGVHVSEGLRGRGLASLVGFVAAWLQLCFRLDVAPSTDRIDKPVVSLLLQKFGFAPLQETCRVDVAEGDGGQVLLWMDNRARLVSTFSSRFLRDQHMALAEEKPPGSRPAHVKTAFSPGDLGALRAQAAQVLHGGLSLGGSGDRARALLEALRGGGWPEWAEGPKGRIQQCLHNQCRLSRHLQASA